MSNSLTSRASTATILSCLALTAFGCAAAPEEESGSSSASVTADEGSSDVITMVRSFAPGRGHLATIRGVPPGFTPEMTFQIRLKGQRALFACSVNAHNMLSLDPNCEGQPMQAFVGYADNNAAGSRSPLYRCNAGNDHFVSPDKNCEGQAFEGLLGWVENITAVRPPPAAPVGRPVNDGSSSGADGVGGAGQGSGDGSGGGGDGSGGGGDGSGGGGDGSGGGAGGGF